MKTPTIYDTIALMRDLHGDQKDKAGAPYWTHPLRVMLRLGQDAHPVERHAALLHDTIEDCGILPLFLAKRGYDAAVLYVVGLMTGGFPSAGAYRSYIDDIAESGNVWAIRVKLADLYDNSAPLRQPLTDPGLANMVQKRYLPAIKRLEDVLQKWRVGFPIAGDPAHGSHGADFYPPYVSRTSATPDLAMTIRLETAIKLRAFGE
jgi:hypothetical protein